MQKISSRDNAKLKNARKVREGRERGHVFIEGVRLVEEVLRSEAIFSDAFVSSDSLGDPRVSSLILALESRGVAVSEVPDKILGQIADTATPQGVIAIGARPETTLDSLSAKITEKPRLPVVVALHEVNNPSNLGAILRTAEAVDASAVVVTQRSADVFSPKSLRASMGAAFRLPIATGATLDDALAWAKSNGLKTTAADVNAQIDYASIDWKTPRMIVFGSEAHGLAPEDFAKIDEGVVIGMKNGVESLNLAVSSGILLFEAKKHFVS